MGRGFAQRVLVLCLDEIYIHMCVDYKWGLLLRIPSSHGSFQHSAKRIQYV